MPKLILEISGCHAAELSEFVEQQIDECSEALCEPNSSPCHIEFLNHEIEDWKSIKQALLDHFHGHWISSEPQDGGVTRRLSND